MEINLFSKCIKELIVENDRVDVPYLGTFTAEMMPASYSDRQTTIHPPYRRMSFRKADVTLADGRLLLDKVRKEIGVTLDQAGVELGWCLSRLCSELEGRKSCKLPGLGVMRANARNEFFFVPDDDLDIWPDGLGFEAIAIKMPKEPGRAEEMPEQVEHDERQVKKDEQELRQPTEVITESLIPENPGDVSEGETAGGVRRSEHFSASKTNTRAVQPEHRRLRPIWIVLIVLAALLLLFIAACYLFTDQMSPILDPLLYSKEELELLRGV
jgi:nucleoid DNA-binding protein